MAAYTGEMMDSINILPLSEQEDVDISVILIATGKYFNYARLLIPQIIKFLDQSKRIQILLFTDNQSVYTVESPRVTITQILIPTETWPDITLYRYHKILGVENLIRGKVLIWCDVDMGNC